MRNVVKWVCRSAVVLNFLVFLTGMTLVSIGSGMVLNNTHVCVMSENQEHLNIIDQLLEKN